MKTDETKKTGDDLSRINAQILAGAGGVKGRTRTVRGKEQNVNQQTIFDEIDRFESVAGRISSSGLADSVIQDTLGTIQIVAEQLDNPDISPEERKNLGFYLDSAQESLNAKDTTGMSKEEKSAYDKISMEVQGEIDNFRDLTQKGKRDADATKTFMEDRADDAAGILIGVLTRNPALMIAHQMFSGYRKNKKESAKKAQDHFNAQLRERKKNLEQKKTALKDGNSTVEKAMPDIDMPDPVDLAGGSESESEPLGEKLDKIIEYTKTTAEKVGLLAGEKSTEIIESSKAIAERASESNDEFRTEMIESSATTAESVKDLVAVAEKSAEATKALARQNKENAIEGGRSGGKKGRGLQLRRGEGDDEGSGGLLHMLGGMAMGGGLLAAGGVAGLMAKGKGILKLMTSFSGLMKLAGKILTPLKLLLRAFGPIGLIITGIAAVFDGFMNVFDKWGDSEGEALPMRLIAAVQNFFLGIIDGFIGMLVGKDNAEEWRKTLVKGVTEFFENIADWLVDQIFGILDSIQDWFAGTWAGKLVGVEKSDRESQSSIRDRERSVNERERSVNETVESSDQLQETGGFTNWISGGLISKDIALKEDADISKMETNTLSELHKDDRLESETRDIIKAELVKRGAIALVSPQETIGSNANDYSNETIDTKSTLNDYSNETIGSNANDYTDQSIEGSTANAMSVMSALNTSAADNRASSMVDQSGSGSTINTNVTTNSNISTRQNIVPETAPRGDSIRAYGTYAQ